MSYVEEIREKAAKIRNSSEYSGKISPSYKWWAERKKDLNKK